MSARSRSFATVACNVLSIGAFLSLLLLAGCGAVGSPSTTPPVPPTTYTIGGTISGLTGTGLVLQDNGGNNLAVSAGATTFAFTTAISTGATYSVTVLMEPSSPSQTCAVTSGSGTVGSANVTSVQIACTTTTGSSYTIGGTIAGLIGTGLVLQDNGGNNLSVGAGATTFTFTTPIASGGGYSVTVLTQPSNPSQTCAVTRGSGTVASANVTSVAISCATTSVTYTIGGTISGLTGAGLVLQDNGGNNLSVGAGATSFTFSTAIPAGSTYSVTVFSQPSSPAQTCALSNATGTATANVTSVGVTCGSGGGGALNEWTWVSGSASHDPSGVYGTLGVAAPGNVPGGRDSAASWVDTSGNLWVFGGQGPAPTPSGGLGYLSDLWRYSAGEWTWMAGSNVPDQASGSGPSPRVDSATWTDAAGNLWLFGGNGYDAKGNVNDLNDLWKYSAGNWVQVGGSNIVQKGTYGTLGTPSASNIPGSREGALTWTDAAGNFWLFGGQGYDSTGTSTLSFGYLNDLWKYSAGEWTWMGGSNLNGQSGSYGVQGTPAPGNQPGGRTSGVTWLDAAGNLWLFGGWGLDSVGATLQLNDLWKYSAGQWTWMTGSNLVGQEGVYGIQGTGAASDTPGSRTGAISWTDANGNFWLFGGAFDTGSSSGTTIFGSTAPANGRG